jgi:hypothetical protein
MDLLVAQRDHGIGLGRTAGGDIATQSSYANQNAPCRKHAKGAPGLVFETWDPRNQCSMDTRDVTTG